MLPVLIREFPCPSRSATRFALEMQLDPKQVREELIAGLNPGVKLVPAHTMVLGLAQARGRAYEQIG